MVWIHEKILCCSIPNINGVSARQVLTKSILQLKKGCIDTQRKNTRINQGKLSLEDPNNKLSIILERHGAKEDFPTALPSVYSKQTTINQPRWFFYGKTPPFPVSTQVNIAQKFMGIKRGANDGTSTKNWIKCYLNNGTVTLSYQSQLSKVCTEHSIDEFCLRHILYYSNFVVTQATRSTYNSASTKSTEKNNTINENVQHPKHNLLQRKLFVHHMVLHYHLAYTLRL